MNIINEDSDDQIDSFELKQKEFETIFFNEMNNKVSPDSLKNSFEINPIKPIVNYFSQ